MAEREILDCKRMIEDEIGQAVHAFAYPYGETSPVLGKIVLRHFDAGFGTRLGFLTAKSPLSALERIDMYYLRKFRSLHAIGDNGLRVYLYVRQWLRVLREGLRER
jgi:hypothetical protein